MLSKLKNWWSGRFNQTPLEHVLEEKEYSNIEKPWIRKVLESFLAYIRRYSIDILAIVIGSLVALFIHFDNSTNNETPDKEHHQQTTTDHKSPSE